MKRILTFVILIIAVSGCSEAETTSEAIRQETDVIDVRVSQSQPKKAFAADSLLRVGFDEDGTENRMLIYVPKITSLYDKSVIVSSIAQIEIDVSCMVDKVNPENIHMYAMTAPWTPFATWNSPAGSLGDMVWGSPGGDFDRSFDVVPSLHRSTADPKAIELGFDVTKMVVKMILEDKPNYGFVITVNKSEDNAEDKMEFLSFNAETVAKPRAVLVYTRNDVVVP